MTLNQISGLLCPPTWGTARTDRPTHGAKAAHVARALGLELMPWQQHVLDVALEFDPVTGRLAYREVGLSVPRQSGKSTLTLVLMTLRCIGAAFGPGQQVLYTAQDALSARQKWEEDHVEALDASPVFKRGRDYSVRLSNGSERIRFSNASIWRISSTTDTAGHGKTLDLAVIDEAFSHQDFRVDQSFRAPMITRPEPQMWVVSTAGTSKSAFLNARRMAGRAAVERGDFEGSAWFEWSAPPDADTLDEEVWAGCSPALGHSISLPVLRSEIRSLVDAGNEQGARRAFLNLTEENDGGEGARIPVEVWLRQSDPETAIVERGVLGVAMTPDRGLVSLGAAGIRPEGDWSVSSVQTAAGSGWVVEAAGRVADSFGVRTVALDGGGPASSLIAPLERAGFNVVKLSGQGFARACGLFVDELDAGRLWHRNEPGLSASVSVAKDRRLGDLWAWARGDGEASVVELEAVTVALGGSASLEEPEKVPVSAVVERGGLFRWDS